MYKRVATHEQRREVNRDKRNRRDGITRLSGICITVIVLFLFYTLNSHNLHDGFVLSLQQGLGHDISWVKNAAVPPYKWSEHPPKTDLLYTPCFDGFQCARLDVPLNWNVTDQTSHPRAAIALIKLPAKVPPTDPQYGGVIIFNPGGPGESGIHQVLSGARDYQLMLDSPAAINASDDSAKYFDIIGFDPRGVNNTTPRLPCFPNPVNQKVWGLEYSDYSQLWESDVVVGYEWARASALGATCSRGNEEGIHAARYVNTAQTVEDIVAIIEAHGRWREKEVKISLAAKKSKHLSASDKEALLQRTAWKPNEEKLLYVGYSYGTLLGATFAAMHPEKVSRMVLDGVVDPTDHYAGTWLTQLQDSDAIISHFCNDCFVAGPVACPLFTGLSGKDVETRLTNIMNGLKSNPISVPAYGNRGPEIITYGDIYLIMLGAMYFPYAWHGTEGFFTLIAQLEKGNVTEIANTKQAMIEPIVLSSACKAAGAYSEACISDPASYISGLGPVQTIACMDAGGPSNMSKQDFREYLGILGNQSRWISKSWARNRLACVGYTVEPAWSFHAPIQGNVSSMLIVGNTHDTVTPLRNARKVSTLFPGSIVLEQDSEGHCSFSNPSICTGGIIREYFQTGRLPESGTVCEPENKPFIGCLKKDDTGSCKLLESADLALWEAMDRRARL